MASIVDSIGFVAQCLIAMLRTGRKPSRRALAALGKLCGIRIERRWPFLAVASGQQLNLGFEDLLELQFSRSKEFMAVLVGAFDGVTNDPTTAFVRRNRGRGILVEPQRTAFARLCDQFGSDAHFSLLNVAIDAKTGERTMFYVPPGIDGLPPWVEQLASFRREHLLAHEGRAPGVSLHIEEQLVATMSFDDLLIANQLSHIDVLQIDAEGFDAQLLEWFPFDRLKPGIVHYEVAHMSPGEHAAVRSRLTGIGYAVYSSDSPSDDMAFLIR